MDRHCENARALAEWLADHPDVSRVYYPGLESHPRYELAAAQISDFGGMLSFELDATLEETGDAVSNTEVFTLAESLGGVESLIEQPAAMTHAAIPRERRIEAGLHDGLVRASVSLEHVDDPRRTSSRPSMRRSTDNPSGAGRQRRAEPRRSRRGLSGRPY